MKTVAYAGTELKFSIDIRSAEVNQDNTNLADLSICFIDKTRGNSTAFFSVLEMYENGLLTTSSANPKAIANIANGTFYQNSLPLILSIPTTQVVDGKLHAINSNTDIATLGKYGLGVGDFALGISAMIADDTGRHEKVVTTYDANGAVVSETTTKCRIEMFKEDLCEVRQF